MFCELPVVPFITRLSTAQKWQEIFAIVLKNLLRSYYIFTDGIQSGEMSSVSGRKLSMIELECSEIASDQVGRNEELALGASIRRYPKVVAYTFGVITGVLFVGYDTVIVGTSRSPSLFEHGSCSNINHAQFQCSIV